MFAEFIQHCFKAFNARSEELDNVLCRLCLYLDVRYKEAAISAGNLQAIFVKASPSHLKHRAQFDQI